MAVATAAVVTVPEAHLSADAVTVALCWQMDKQRHGIALPECTQGHS